MARRALRTPTLETLFVAAFALLGLRLGLRPIGDNSFFVHLRTGIDVVDGLGIPREDPYSFTARGEPWVVQSWLPSLIYGILHRIAGLEALVVLHGVVYACLGGLVATLARTGRGGRTAFSALLAVGIGMPYWAPRPLAVGLIAMALTVTAVERRLPAALLVPVAWVWVNSHGSFVLGALWLVLVVLAGRSDARRYLGWFALGAVVSTVNPLGPRLLAFPLQLLVKRDNFARVVEWRPPWFRSAFVSVALVCLVVAVVLIAIAMRRGRVTSRDVLPAAVFVLLGLAAQRNLAVAAIVLAPLLGRAVAGDAVPDLTRRRIAHLGFASAIGATAVVFVAVAASAEPLDLDGYPPERALAAVAGAERVVTTDVSGCYRILRQGRQARVFVDDRYDLYPEQVIADFLRLLDGDRASVEVLDRYAADAVMWPRREELAALLDRSPAWRRALVADEWVVYLRRR